MTRSPLTGLKGGVLLAAALAAACQSARGGAPALLDADDAQTMEAVKAVLAGAVGRATIELGPGDPTETSTLSVLPPRPGRYEDRSLATPTLFDLVISDGLCYAVRRDTEEAFLLEGVSCSPA